MSGKPFEQIVLEKEFFNDIKQNFHREFQQEEGIPIYTGFYIGDLRALELKPWVRMGGLGAYVNLYGEENVGDNYVCEIPPGRSLKPQRHLFEELVYVLSGRGATTFGNREGGPKGTFEWKEHSFFALPANIEYQHFNGDENKPARFFAKTTLPLLFQCFKNKGFIFENSFVMEDIEKDFYTTEAKIYRQSERPDSRVIWTANFIPDVMAFDKMADSQARGAGGTNIHFYQPCLVRLHAHLSEFPVGTYKKAHAHPPGRSIIMITGKGFSLLWQPGKEKEKQKVDWKPGSVFGVALSPLQGECWYHQHFNTGNEPARYLVLHVNDALSDKHITVGYVDEEPEIKNLFESELTKSGITSKMPPECYSDPKFKWKD